MSPIERCQERLNGLQEQYYLLSEKIRLLRRDSVIENDVAARYKYEQYVDIEESNLEKLGREIEALEGQIAILQREEIDQTGPELDGELNNDLVEEIPGKLLRPVPTLLGKYDGLIEQLLIFAGDSHLIQQKRFGQCVIEAIARIFEADLVYQVESSDGHKRIIFADKSPRLAEDFNILELQETIKNFYPRVVELNGVHYLENFEYQSKKQKIENCIVVPVKERVKTSLIFICNYRKNLEAIADVLGIILNEVKRDKLPLYYYRIAKFD